jgi:hypothetical protein
MLEGMGVRPMHKRGKRPQPSLQCGRRPKINQIPTVNLPLTYPSNGPFSSNLATTCRFGVRCATHGLEWIEFLNDAREASSSATTTTIAKNMDLSNRSPHPSTGRARWPVSWANVAVPPSGWSDSVGEQAQPLFRFF